VYYSGTVLLLIFYFVYHVLYMILTTHVGSNVTYCILGNDEAKQYTFGKLPGANNIYVVLIRVHDFIKIDGAYSITTGTFIVFVVVK
jgi:hypothetical protein